MLKKYVDLWKTVDVTFLHVTKFLSLSSTVRYIRTKVSIVFVCSFFNLRNFQLESDVCRLTYMPNEDSRRFWSRVIHANRRE